MPKQSLLNNRKAYIMHYRRYFKETGTLRERSDLGTFAKNVTAYMVETSRCAPDFPAAPTVPPKVWRSAQLMMESGILMHLTMSESAILRLGEKP